MSSSWVREAWATFDKERLVEVRSPQGLWTAGMFVFVASFAMGFGALVDRPQPSVAAGMYLATLLFIAVTAVPRTFLIEDERNTIDLLRVLARPGPAFFGKALYCASVALGAAGIAALCFALFVRVEIPLPGLFVVSTLALTLAMVGGVSLCGALVMGAANRWLLVGATAMPLLLPTMVMGVVTIRVSFGSGLESNGWLGALGTGGFALCLWAVGPALVDSLWRLRGTEDQEP